MWRLSKSKREVSWGRQVKERQVGGGDLRGGGIEKAGAGVFGVWVLDNGLLRVGLILLVESAATRKKHRANVKKGGEQGAGNGGGLDSGGEILPYGGFWGQLTASHI